MASVKQKIQGQAKSGKFVFSKTLTLTMVAGATASGSVELPLGSYLHGIRGVTPAAFSGSPTNINARVGSAAAGQQFVADVDLKGAASTGLTVLGSAAVLSLATAVFFQIAASGGTAPAGSVTFIVTYTIPQ